MKKVISVDAVKMLQNEDSILIDVRTPEEWKVKSVQSMNNNEVIFLSIMTYPDMMMNSNFVNDFIELKIKHNQKLFFVCKAGRRSDYAAEICSKLGYECYNIVDGVDSLISAINA